MNFDPSNINENDSDNNVKNSVNNNVYTESGYGKGYEDNYNKKAPLITSSSQDFWGRDERIQIANRSSGQGAGRSTSAQPPRRRRRRLLKRPNFKKLGEKLAGIRLPKRQAAAKQPVPRKKRTPVTAACISGLICAALVLFTEVGIWGLYCFSRGLPGDTNVNASTFMYCFALFAGCFWAGAVVKRRSLKPVLLLCGVFMVMSVLVSLHLFSLKEFKLSMILLKLLFTVIAAMLGFVLSLVPYLINKALKQQRQQRRQSRQRPSQQTSQQNRTD